MRDKLSLAPGAVWTALLVGLPLLAQYLGQYYGGVAWVGPVVGLITIVLVPLLRALLAAPAEPELLAGRRSTQRRAVERWLW